jgi:hypothetical protein
MAVGEALAVVGLVTVGGVSISGAGFWAWHAYRTGRLRSGWLWLRVKMLGGVTTLEQTLSYDCAICQEGLEANERVRKLSCGHVFHHRGNDDKCTETIEKWLYEGNLTCPFCRKAAVTVWPWNARPPLSAVPETAAAPTPATSASAPLEQSSVESSTESLLPLSTPMLGDEEESGLSP